MVERILSKLLTFAAFKRRSITFAIIAAIFCAHIGLEARGRETTTTEGIEQEANKDDLSTGVVREERSKQKQERGAEKTSIRKSEPNSSLSRLTQGGSISNSMVSTIGALALVLCVFFVLAYLAKIIAPNRKRQLSGSLEIIDSCAVDSKITLTTFRWGNRLLLVAKSSGRLMLLSELKEQQDVERFLRDYSIKIEERKNSWLDALLNRRLNTVSRADNEDPRI